MRTMLVALTGMAVMSGLIGCGGGNPISMAGSAGKTAFKAVRGAQADAVPIRMSSPGSLAGYRSIRLGEVTTDVSPICTPEVLGKVRNGIREGLDDDEVRKAFPGGGKVLRMDVVCRLYKERGTFGGEGRLDWMVTLVDAETDEAVGVMFVQGESESALRHGAGDMAKANTKELVKYLRKHNRS